ncbi:hypothetical protein [Archaeoglobus neptunius]|uniref:hypothetical protein n=1 Tax=Archaeoglobus neptunius TaxID=2798580 RepID=UPI001928198C|nr:hypothetical protein [Archaeoglobus neptunius]
MMMETKNKLTIDKISAKIGFDLAKKFTNKDDADKLETIVTKAIGVLIEDGLLAYVIWLKSRGEKERKYATEILNKSKDLIRELDLATTDDPIDMALEISSSIEKTLLARQLLERMLVYARYRAKALQKGE